MKLLDELRNVDPTNPGQWSRQVSVTLACLLFVLVGALGLQVRVRGSLLPELAGAGEQLPRLEAQLAQARREQRQTQSLSAELQQLAEQLGRTGASLPRSRTALNLAVSLAQGSDGSAVAAVRPWQPASETSRPLPHGGAELRLNGGYGEIVEAVHGAVGTAELRELIELSIEPGDAADDGAVRAEARLLAYYANEAHGEFFPDAPKREPAMAHAPPGLGGLLSPFAPLAGARGEDAAAAAVDTLDSPPRGGIILVGARRYRIVDDPQGGLLLEPEAP